MLEDGTHYRDNSFDEGRAVDLNEGFVFPESAALSACQDDSGHISDGFFN
jgi:hypothetical protein